MSVCKKHFTATLQQKNNATSTNRPHQARPHPLWLKNVAVVEKWREFYVSYSLQFSFEWRVVALEKKKKK